MARDSWLVAEIVRGFIEIESWPTGDVKWLTVANFIRTLILRMPQVRRRRRLLRELRKIVRSKCDTLTTIR